MRNPISLRLCLSSLLVCALCISAQAENTNEPADDAAQVAAKEAAKKASADYRKKFGKEEREVRRTKETNDDAEFAQRLISEADSGKHDPGLTTHLYEKAYEVGLRDTTSFPTSSSALDKLLEEDAARKFEVGEMRLMLWEKWHETKPDVRVLDPEDFIDLCMDLSNAAVEAGDTTLALKFLNRGNRFGSRNGSARTNDVRDSISDLMRTRKLQEEIAELEEALATDPSAADKLAMLYLTDMDDPAKAVAYADKMQDKALAVQVRLAAIEFELATPTNANAAGLFYYSLVTDLKIGQPVEMLIRARVWLTEYLSREPDEAEAVKAAHKTLGEIDAELLKRGIGKKLRRKMSSAIRGEGQFARPADVQAAIDKGVKWLYEQRDPQRHWETDPEKHRNYGGYTALVVYAMLMADEEPRLNGDLSRSIHFMMNATMQGTYPICFRIHAWEVMPRRERYRQTLVQDVNRLRKGATRHGFWGYTMTGKDVVPGKKLDVSTTLAGGLGLWIGEEVGGITPKKIYWERTARALMDHQLDDDGWSYNPATMKTSQGAMTAGSLALLYASYPHLGEAMQVKADESIARGMKWMDANFSATTNVNRAGFTNYYFAAVQHAGLFSGQREFRELDWYESIAAQLIKTQAANGSMGNVSETAFAIAFLCRGGVTYEPTESDNADPDSADDTSADSENDTPSDTPTDAGDPTPAE